MEQSVFKFGVGINLIRFLFVKHCVFKTDNADLWVAYSKHVIGPDTEMMQEKPRIVHIYKSVMTRIGKFRMSR